MQIKTRIFEICETRNKNLSELAQTMEISISQVYRVKEGKRKINQKFIVGAIKAFPKHKLEDLFYLVPEVPNVTNQNNHRTEPTIIQYSPNTQRQKIRL
ncbi:MAG: helix-turn-helix transcriptional regulator [Dehalococcoidales bacterium]|nr:helix-turn-helix transcriptional regulator [Dehalococcoidales bacterium]